MSSSPLRKHTDQDHEGVRSPDAPAANPVSSRSADSASSDSTSSGSTSSGSTAAGSTAVGSTSSASGGESKAPAQRSGATVAPADRRAVVAREKERYGGIKWGSAFFGWLTATGTAVLLTALLVAAGATVGAATGADATDAQGNAATLGLVGGLTLLAVILVAYYCGGYVAGRMARFNGVKQGIAVWIWAVVIVTIVAVAGSALGDKYDLLDRVGGFPRLPVGGDNVTTGSIVAVVIAVVAALVGAVLGGLAGMRFHRKVDEAGLGR